MAYIIDTRLYERLAVDRERASERRVLVTAHFADTETTPCGKIIKQSVALQVRWQLPPTRPGTETSSSVSRFDKIL